MHDPIKVRCRFMCFFSNPLLGRRTETPVLGQCSISILPETRKTSGFLMFSASIAMGQ